MDFLKGTEIVEQISIKSVDFITTKERVLADYANVITSQKSFAHFTKILQRTWIKKPQFSTLLSASFSTQDNMTHFYTSYNSFIQLHL